MTTAPRPRSVAFACLGMGFACLILLLSIVDSLQNWGSLELQREVEKALASGPLATESLTVSEAMDILRWVFMGVLVLAIAGMVFAVFSLRGDRTSRNFLTGVWVIIGWSLAGVGGASVIGVLFAVLLVYLLWMPESRRWFAGEPEPAKREESTPRAEPALVGPASADLGAPVGATSPVPGAPAASRPRSVLIATTVALVGSIVVASVSGLSLAMLAVVHGQFAEVVDDNPMLRDVLTENDLSSSTLYTISVWTMAVLFVSSLLGAGAAAWAMAGKRAGMVALILATSVTLMVSIVGFPVGIPGTVAAIVVLVLLRQQDAREWYRIER